MKLLRRPIIKPNHNNQNIDDGNPLKGETEESPKRVCDFDPVKQQQQPSSNNSRSSSGGAGGLIMKITTNLSNNKREPQKRARSRSRTRQSSSFTRRQGSSSDLNPAEAVVDPVKPNTMTTTTPLSPQNKNSGKTPQSSRQDVNTRSGSRGRSRKSNNAPSISSTNAPALIPAGPEDLVAAESYSSMSMDSTASRQDQQMHLASDIYRNLASPSYVRTNSSRKNSKKSIAPMPTLSEALTEEDESTTAGSVKQRDLIEDEEHLSSFDSWDETNLSFEIEQSDEQPQASGQVPSSPSRNNHIKPTTTSTCMVQPTVMQLLSMDEHEKACEQIKSIMDDARNQASEGHEEDAIQTYKKALQIGRQDVHRIKGQLVKKCSFTDRFHHDWIEIGVLLAEIRTCQATLHERLLDHNHAMSCLQEAIGIFKRQATFYKSRNKEKARSTLQQIQNLEAGVARSRAARKHDAKRKQVHEQILQFQKDAATAPAPNERQNYFLQMQEMAQTLRSLEVEVFGETHPLVADANSLLGAIALEQGNVETAVVSMKQSLVIMKKSLGMKHPRTGTKLLHLASVFASQGQDTAAIDHYMMAVAVFRSCNATKLVGSTLNDVAVIHIQRKEFETAIRLLRESLEAYNSEESSWDTAQVWRNLGECYCQLKDFTNGVSALEQALNVQREGRELFDKAVASSDTVSDNVPPLHLVDDPSIADTLRRLGKAYYGGRQFESALSYYKEACLIHKAEVKKVVHVSKSRSNLSLPARQDELAQTIYCMAELYDRTREFDQAAKLYSESLQLRLFSDAHKETRSNMVHCAMCLYGLGGIHMQRGEFDEAANVVCQALSYCEAHGVPENNVIYTMIKARLDIAERNSSSFEEGPSTDLLQTSADSACPSEGLSDIQAMEKQAEKAVALGDLEEAVQILTQVMQQRKIMLQNSKGKADQAASVKYETACTLFTFGKVLAMRGDRKSAERAFKDALKLFKKSGTSPDAEIVLQLSEELRKVNRSA